MQSTGSRSAYARAPRRRASLLLLGWLLLGWLLPVWGLSGCLRFDYESLTNAEPFDGLTPVSLGPQHDLSVESDAGGAAALPFGLAPGDGINQSPHPQRRDPSNDVDAGGNDLGPPTPPAGTIEGAGGSAGAGAQACLLSGNERVVNGFDTPSGGLQARGPGNPTLNWTGSVGNPNAGALEFQNRSAGGGEVYYPGSLGDLRGRRMSLNVQVASGTGVRVRIFVESGPQRRRAQGPFSSPALGQWDCSQLSLDAPDSADGGFDPANIVAAGLEIESSDQVRVYVDQIAY